MFMMSIRKVSCHSKTLLHRNLTQERLFYKKGYFLKPTRETTNVLTIKVIHYFSSWNLLEAVIWRCSQIFTKFTAKNLCLRPATLFKEALLQMFDFHETSKDTFFHRTPPSLVISFKLIFPSFYIRLMGL